MNQTWRQNYNLNFFLWYQEEHFVVYKSKCKTKQILSIKIQGRVGKGVRRGQGRINGGGGGKEKREKRRGRGEGGSRMAKDEAMKDYKGT